MNERPTSNSLVVAGCTLPSTMSLNERLSNCLPKDKSYTVLHYQNTPRETHPVVTPSSDTSKFQTFKAEHFITLAHEGVLIFAIEIYVYITLNMTRNQTEVLLFVAKADTTGFNDTKVRVGLVTRAIIEYLLNIPVSHYFHEIVPKHAYKYDADSITKFTSTKDALKILLERKQGTRKIPVKIQKYSIKDYPSRIIHKISFFTRAEQQYIFPYSGDNGKKHVLSGADLLKWWIHIVDEVVLANFESDTLATLCIPGEDPLITKKYLSPLKYSNWSVGDIFHAKGEDTAVFKIPLFPDDPKGRFLEHLVVENRVKKVNTSQFWQELQIRQEFRLGVTVSVVGVEGKLNGFKKSDADGLIQLPYRDFKKLKDYITGEEYHDEEGATDALGSSLDYLRMLGYEEIQEVEGKWVRPVKKIEGQPTVNVLPVNNLSMLVRKKKKTQ